MVDQFEGDILVVDDTRPNLRLLAQMLSSAGYKVRPVTDGPQALAAVHSTPPDLILLDIMMPGMNGYEVCARLKAEPQTKDIPIIFISALDVVEDKVKAFQAGGVDYITKPFQVNEVLARIETHISLRSLQARMERQLEERETLIAELDNLNASLQQKVAERQAAQRDLQVALTQAESLYQIARSLIAYESLSTMLQAVIDRISQILPADRVVLFTLDLEAKEVTRFVKGGAGTENVIRPSFEELMQGLTGWALKRVQPVLSSKGRPDPRESPAVQKRRVETNCGAIIVAPLYYRERAFGTLTAINTLEQHNFDQKDLSLLLAIASQIAIAVNNTEAEEKLRQYTVELEAQNAELDAFAHTVAHDLKTPLTALQGFSALLEKRFPRMSEDKIRQNLRIMGQNARTMGSIIDELLLLASVRGMEGVELQPLDMPSLVAEARQRLDHLIEKYEPEIVLPETWPAAAGYGPWIEEVWVNYLSNALKYGGRPPRIEFEAQLQRDGQVCFWVRDNGQGVTPEAQARLFTPFERLHQVHAKGHGLGLSIVKRIVEKLGGRVGVESEVGVGSKFFFTLPSAQN